LVLADQTQWHHQKLDAQIINFCTYAKREAYGEKPPDLVPLDQHLKWVVQSKRDAEQLDGCTVVGSEGLRSLTHADLNQAAMRVRNAMRVDNGA
jgi:hypothetical protein